MGWIRYGCCICPLPAAILLGHLVSSNYLSRSTHLTTRSDYAAKVFGFATFGRIYGTVVCISGITNFAQSALDALVYKKLHGDPLPVNIFLGAIGAVVGIALTAFVAVKGREFVQEKEELEEQQPLVAEQQAGYGATGERE